MAPPASEVPAPVDYSEVVAFKPERVFVRKGLALMTRTVAWDFVLGLLYVPVACFTVPAWIVSVVVIHMTLRAPKETPDGVNTSTTRGSVTAFTTLKLRDDVHRQGFGEDFMAGPLLAQVLNQYSALTAVMTHTSTWLAAAMFRVFNRDPGSAFARILVQKHMSLFMHFRTSWLDDVLETFVRGAGVSRVQILFLGAGFDTRSYRLVSLKAPNVSLFEADAPPTQRQKREALAGAGVDSSHVTFVGVNFAEKGAWLAAVMDAGLDPSLPTCCIWEGVAMYLTKEQVLEDLLLFANKFASGSTISFDYISKYVMESKWTKKAMKRLGEEFKFSLSPSSEAGDTEVKLLLSPTSLVLREHLTPRKLFARYMPVRANGSNAFFYQQSEHGGYVVASVT